MLKKLNKPWIYYIAHGILALFMGILVYVIMVAYGRKTGATGLDMAKIQKLRYDAVQQAKLDAP